MTSEFERASQEWRDEVEAKAADLRSLRDVAGTRRLEVRKLRIEIERTPETLQSLSPY